MNTRNSQIEFIRINGVAIAACAWNGYKTKRRGMVCVLSDLENEVLHQVPFDFMQEIAGVSALFSLKWSIFQERPVNMLHWLHSLLPQVHLTVTASRRIS